MKTVKNDLKTLFINQVFLRFPKSFSGNHLNRPLKVRQFTELLQQIYMPTKPF